MDGMIKDLNLKLDGTCEGAVSMLRQVLDDAYEAINAGETSLADRNYHKACICVETRTAFSVLKDLIRWEIRRPMSDSELLRFGQKYVEYHEVKSGLQRAVEAMMSLGAGEDDPFLESVTSKLNLMSN